ncbi:hypothetical protein VNO77_34408 [Canavalia gladiata]|uniref:Uncharacterized protein n=1 Tax=Canavalia gladiata TaxID=3824 RepID=A0AAN9PX75_CANGL
MKEKGFISSVDCGKSRRETWPKKKRLSDPRDSFETPTRRRRFQARRRCTCKKYLATNASPLPLNDLSTKDRTRSSNRIAIEVDFQRQIEDAVIRS